MLDDEGISEPASQQPSEQRLGNSRSASPTRLKLSVVRDLPLDPTLLDATYGGVLRDKFSYTTQNVR